MGNDKMMDGYALDLDSFMDYEETSFEPIPAGKYPFTIMNTSITNYEPSETSKIKTPCQMLEVEFVIDASSVERGEMTIRRNYFLLGGKQYAWAVSNLSNLFSATGLVNSEGKFRIDPDALIEKTGIAKVIVEPDRNDKSKKYNRIDKLFPGPKKSNDYDDFE